MIFGYEYEPENSDRGTFAYCPLWHGISLEALRFGEFQQYGV